MKLFRHIVAAAVAAILLPAIASAATPIVAIDPGHGGADGGAVGVIPAGTETGLPVRINATTGETNILEKDVNLDIGNRLDAYLRARGYATVLTRTRDLAGGDKPYTTELNDLQDRVAVAEAAHATIFVSLHENALSSTTSGTETYHYYYGSENSKVLAKLIHENLVAALRLPDRGVREAGFYVLRRTSMPAVLIEGMFLTNPAEALLLADPAVRQTIAEAVGSGIVTYFESGGADVATPVVTESPKYQVNVGVFRQLAKAKRRYRAVRARGYQAIVASQYSRRYRRAMFFVVAGRFVQLDNARQLRSGLRSGRLPANIGPVPTKSRTLKVS